MPEGGAENEGRYQQKQGRGGLQNRGQDSKRVENPTNLILLAYTPLCLLSVIYSTPTPTPTEFRSNRNCLESVRQTISVSIPAGAQRHR